MKVTVKTTEYNVSVLPEEHIDYHTFALTVAYRGDERWAVTRFRQCLSTDGTWDHESIPSERTNEWLSTHRFDLDTALALAVKYAPDARCNGHTAREIAERLAAAVPTEGPNPKEQQ